MTPAEKEIITSRIYGFIETHPNSTATEIAENISESRQKVVESIKGDPRFHVFKERGELAARYNLRKHGERLSTEIPKKDAMAEAIDGLVGPLTTHIKGKIDAELDRIMKAEVNAAIVDIEKRVKQRLCDSLSISVKLDSFTIDNIGAKDPAPRNNSIVDAEFFPEFTKAAERTKFNPPASTVFTNPPGDFVPHDVLSKRTSHKSHGLIEPKQDPVKTTESTKSPKLVIVGIHTNKQELIKREFRDKFDLRLFNPDQRSYIKNSLQKDDDVLILADYVSHAHVEVAESAGARVTIVKGGIPSLREEISKRLMDKVAA